ncbi:hypothetical protein Syun_021348 [Stephania yunnanensis]|uniref:Uncharacterized protein n=1 Tax=Stephania yunnanensis TaxID=152371 RepID=A0AAP0NS73_9MAGN
MFLIGQEFKLKPMLLWWKAILHSSKHTQQRKSSSYRTDRELKKLLKKTNDPEVTANLKNRISWIDKQLKTESAKSTEKAIQDILQAN